MSFNELVHSIGVTYDVTTALVTATNGNVVTCDVTIALVTATKYIVLTNDIAIALVAATLYRDCGRNCCDDSAGSHWPEVIAYFDSGVTSHLVSPAEREQASLAVNLLFQIEVDNQPADGVRCQTRASRLVSETWSREVWPRPLTTGGRTRPQATLFHEYRQFAVGTWTYVCEDGMQ